MHKLSMLALAAAAALCPIVTMAQEGAVTRTISPATGTFESSSGWSQKWTGSGESPRVYLTASRRDMAAAASGGIDLREGSANSSVYTITTDGGWRVSGFTLTFIGNSATNPTTVTSGGFTIVSSATEPRTLSVSDLGEYDVASFTLTGANQGITSQEFTVTLVPVKPEEYIEAEVDLKAGSFMANGTAGQWHAIWQNADTEEQRVFLTSENQQGAVAANMKASEAGLDLREGSAKASNYYISTAGSWRVCGYELQFSGNSDSSPVTVSGGGQTLTSSTGQVQTLRVENLNYGTKAGFSVAGQNQGINLVALKVLLSPTSPASRGVTVFTYTGSHPYRTVYRIPTLAYIPAGAHAGRILAVNDYRPCGSDIGYGEVDLHTSVSDDMGLNWSFPADPVDAQGRHVADGDGKGSPATSNANRDCGFGDPALVADRESGDLLMLGVCGRVPIGQATRAIPQGLATWTSRDGGDTWTQWRDITEEILTQLDNNCQYGAVDGLFFTAGRIVQSRYIKVGSHYRLYTVGGGRSASIPDTQCWVFYSDDFGQSWHILGDPYKPALTTGGSEPKCEELPDGSVLYSGRTGGGRNFNVFTYTDIENGDGTWDAAEFGRMKTGAASCNGDAMIVPVRSTADGTGAYLLMQSIPLNAQSRVNVGLNFKLLANGFDDFGSAHAVANDWDGAYQVSQLGSAYSSLTLLPDGRLGFIYEESTYGRDYCEIFRTLTVEQITSGAYRYEADADLATALELTSQLVDGKLAQARADHPDRSALLAALTEAADAFHAAPSTVSYLDFNRALRSFNTNGEYNGVTVVTADYSPADGAEAPLFDLLGRRVAHPLPGHIYVSPAAGKLIIR